jgi:APA family basic amino acid/polyamine antiporter
MTRSDGIARQIGFWTCLALVIGNTIGTGIFMLPASLAPFGWNAIAGWVISIGGALCLAHVFAGLAKAMPRAGGPYDYIAAAFGPMAGFFVMWSYWISQWVTNAALGIGLVSYMAPFAPGFFARPLVGPLLAMFFVLLMTAIALRGVRASGAVQIVTTILKIVPLVAVILVAGIVIGGGDEAAASASNVAPVPLGPAAIAGSAALALWALQGFEAGTVPAGRVIDPARTIPRAILIGTIIVGILYVLATLGIFLLLPAEVTAKSSAPFADLMSAAWSPRAGQAVALFAMVSALGALNGWVFCQAEVAMVLAERGVFPRFFAVKNRNGMPTYGLVLGCALSLGLIATNLSSGMVQIYSFIILLATVATLVLYLAAALTALALLKRGVTKGLALLVTATIGTVYTLWTFYGAGAEATIWGAALIAAGIPVYAFTRSRAGSSPAAAEPAA